MENFGFREFRLWEISALGNFDFGKFRLWEISTLGKFDFGKFGRWGISTLVHAENSAAMLGGGLEHARPPPLRQAPAATGPRVGGAEKLFLGSFSHVFQVSALQKWCVSSKQGRGNARNFHLSSSRFAIFHTFVSARRGGPTLA